MPSYHTLVWEAWIPMVRLAIQRWQSRMPDSLVGQLILICAKISIECTMAMWLIDIKDMGILLQNASFWVTIS